MAGSGWRADERIAAKEWRSVWMEWGTGLCTRCPEAGTRLLPKVRTHASPELWEGSRSAFVHLQSDEEPLRDASARKMS